MSRLSQSGGTQFQNKRFIATFYTRDKVGQEAVTLELIEVAQITEHVNNASTANALIVNK